MLARRSRFRDTTVNPLFTGILTLCRPHGLVMLQRRAVAKTRNQCDLRCAVCDRCPRGTGKLCRTVRESRDTPRGLWARWRPSRERPVYIPWSLQMLTQRQKDALKRHAAHHTKAHMEYMRHRIHAGGTFSEAHRKAQTHVGK